jgi:hypothetical protein
MISRSVVNLGAAELLQIDECENGTRGGSSLGGAAGKRGSEGGGDVTRARKGEKVAGRSLAATAMTRGRQHASEREGKERVGGRER